ncbi:tumor necrosis factor receptor superfamily member 11A isoform 1-T1 [Clarias gariepinus]|uniref:tumor necrosis factor receptor superfamily member 11A isoform X1 n=1 Tax=Clarias gariepinus TaxID=13013 RepID=UPI00234DB345|nr:tumor necrosis factor receptor superfamily member 11A isoform X1 [Clarias gariepinus]
MRAYFSTSWIFRGWIYCLIFALCIQRKHAKPICNDLQYLQGNKCCSKCKPGTYLSATCTENEDTKCRPCGKNEYQSKYTTEKRCYPQKFCDEGKGFYRPNPSSTTELEPCQCKEGFQCTTSYCEFCDRIKPCPPGQGLAGETGKQACKDCDYGFFSDSNSVEACKKWTDCKAIGKSEEKPGSHVADVVCGPPFEPPPSWAVVAIPCAIIVMCAVILSCYKDKLNILSVNLRTCVQNIKQSRIQQETLTPPYNSNRPLYEITSQVDEGTPEYLSMCSKSVRDSPGLDKAQGNKKTPYSSKLEKDRADGSSGSSAEGSESPCTPHPGSSCSCLIMKEPVEVGENEDCSELVATGLAGCCSCAQVDNVVPEPRKDDNGSLKEPPLCGNFYTENVPGCLQGSQELYLDYSSGAGKEVMSVVRDLHSDTSAYERNEPQCCSIESTAVLSSLSTSNNQGLSLISSADNNQPKADADLEIQSQSLETALTCAQVTGNNNTTFISTGQVMNFTGDVIMVYVSQTSLGSSGDEEPYASPVQEQSAECANQNLPKSYQRTDGHERHIPVQEMTNQRLQRNQNLSV